MRKAYSPKKRNTRNRQRKSVILISAEGKNKTEKLYFEAFNGGNVNIKFAKGNETDPVHLARALCQEYEKLELSNEYGDQAYCIVDGDLSELQENLIRQAESRLKKINGEVIASNPCFEIWFLCHFTYSTKQYTSSAEVINSLKRYIPDYEKGCTEMHSILSDKTETAVANAKRLINWHTQMKTDLNRYTCQPHTAAYKIVELILQKS